MALAALAERQLMAAPGGSQTSLDATLIKQHAGPVPVQRRVVVDIPARAAAAKALAAGATPEAAAAVGAAASAAVAAAQQ